MVIWLTGLSSSGKSTIALDLKDEILSRWVSWNVQILDGDVVRKNLFPELKFSMDDRYENIDRTRYLAKMLSDNDVIVIVAAITPYEIMRIDNRDMLGSDYVEVFVNTDIEDCIKRDVKGLYKKAIKKEISNMTGIDDPYEIPMTPDIVCYTEGSEVSEMTSKIIKFIDPMIASKQKKFTFRNKYVTIQ
jgi:adenylylsulfate kinase